MRLKECPNCGADISDSYESADPSVGITGTGWFCEACELFVEDDSDPFEGEYDRRRTATDTTY
jgi:hypothetical protein